MGSEEIKMVRFDNHNTKFEIVVETPTFNMDDFELEFTHEGLHVKGTKEGKYIEETFQVKIPTDEEFEKCNYFIIFNKNEYYTLREYKN